VTGATRRFALALLVLAAPCALAGAGGDAPLERSSISFFGLAGQSFKTSFHGFSEAASAVVEAATAIGPRLELGLDLHPLIVISQPETYQGEGRETVPAFALDAVLRWYPALCLGSARPYVEVAEGPYFAVRRTPTEATRWNFLTQAGAGVVIPTGERWWTIVGYRWFHISNANLGDRNPAWNYHTLVVGGRLFIR
jgi:hypothetical protein